MDHDEEVGEGDAEGVVIVEEVGEEGGSVEISSDQCVEPNSVVWRGGVEVDDDG
jgi:hypothetical protein